MTNTYRKHYVGMKDINEDLNYLYSKLIVSSDEEREKIKKQIYLLQGLFVHIGRQFPKTPLRRWWRD